MRLGIVYNNSIVSLLTLSSLLQQSLPQIHLNLLDFIIIGIVLFYAHEGYTLGFSIAFVDLLSFLFSFIIALKGYTLIAHILVFVAVPLGVANAIGFFVVALVCEVGLGLLFRKLRRSVPSLPVQSKAYQVYKGLDHALGIFPGIASSVLVLAFLLSIIVALPSSPFLKNLVTGSRFGSGLIDSTSLVEKNLQGVFGGAFNETLNFLTVEPKSNETVYLHFKTTHGTIDQTAEEQMLIMVNEQRRLAGLAPLTLDTSLRELGRYYGNFMFANGYFSHYSPNGESPFDRMHSAEITFNYAGENLALAPDVKLAMQGLMQSPEHRGNILDPHYKKIGIGVIDGGIYGEMFVQEFTD